MTENDKTEFQIEVSIADATKEELDRFTRQLLSELKETDVESAELLKEGTAPEGTMSGDVVTIGSIALQVIPAVLPSVLGVVQSWVSRGSNRTVKFKGKVAGQAIEFEGSASDLHKLLEKLERGKKK